MKRLFHILGISSLLTIFWFSSGYILSLFLHMSINLAFILAGLAFIISFGYFSALENNSVERYR